jgi:hypothetical protein
VRIVLRRGGRGVALALAAALDAVLLDTRGALRWAAGRGPDGRDVLAGRATVVEALRTVGGVPVVGWGGPLAGDRLGRLARLVERAAERVVIR